MLQSGDLVRGHIRSFDSFCIILENPDAIMLLYKHALSMIRPAESGVNIPGLI
jgi:RNA chaperone Hfq